MLKKQMALDQNGMKLAQSPVF